MGQFHRSYLALLSVALVSACSAVDESASEFQEQTGALDSDIATPFAPNPNVPRDGREFGWTKFGNVPPDGDSICTATLIGRRTIVAAAHCVGYQDRVDPNNPMDFVIDNYDHPNKHQRTYHTYRLTDVHVFSEEDFGHPWNGDFLIARLSDRVPNNVATPANIAGWVAFNGLPVTMFGHGFRGHAPDLPEEKIMRYYNFTFSPVGPLWGMPANPIRGGDSGGPLVHGTHSSRGDVLGVISGGAPWSPTYLFKEEVLAVIKNWEGTRGMGDRSFIAAPRSTTTASSFAQCEGACFAQSWCQAFSLAGSSCSLFDARYETRFADAVESGYRPVAYKGASGSGLRLEGTIISTASVTAAFTPEDLGIQRCKEACSSNAACVAYSLAPQSGNTRPCTTFSSVSAQTSASASGWISGFRKTWELGINRPGMDLENFAVSSPQECLQRCATNGRCKTVTVRTAQPQRCWLKYGVPNPTLDASFNSAVQRGAEFQTDRSGNTVESVPLKNDGVGLPYYEMCRALCAARSDCKAWTFQPQNHTQDPFSQAMCHLKSGYGLKSSGNPSNDSDFRRHYVSGTKASTWF